MTYLFFMDAFILDLASFQLSMIGIMVSLLSIVFAVVVGKCDELRAIKNDRDASAANRKVALKNSKAALSSYCKQIVAIIIVLLVLYLGTLVLKSVKYQALINYCEWVDVGLTAGLLVWMSVVTIKAWKKVNKDL